MRLTIGRVFILSSTTREADRISFCTLYFGGHALNCGVRSFLGEDPYLAMKQEITTAFNHVDFAAIIRLMDIHFGMHTYSLKNLFRDEQRHILQLIIAGTLQEFEDKLTTLYENSRGLMGFLKETGMPVPHRFMTTAETALNMKLQKMFTTDSVEMDRLSEVVNEIKNWDVTTDHVSLEFIIRRKLEESMAALREKPDDEQRLSDVLQLVESIAALPVGVNLWHAQNIYWDMLIYSSSTVQAATEESDTLKFRGESVRKLGQMLYFNVDAALAARGAI